MSPDARRHYRELLGGFPLDAMSDEEAGETLVDMVNLPPSGFPLRRVVRLAMALLEAPEDAHGDRAGPARIGRDDDDMSDDDMRASAALAALVEKAHPGLDLPTREDIARGGYQGFKLGWDAREVADQLPDHAAPAAEPVVSRGAAVTWDGRCGTVEQPPCDGMAIVRWDGQTGELDHTNLIDVDLLVVVPSGWGPDVEAEYQALLQLVAGPPGERREGFLRLRHPRRLDL